MNNTLPDHLIFEKILPKLPVKSLLRFKSVSKLWLSTISSHKFVQTHLKFSSSHLQALITHGRYLYEGSSVLSFDECNNFKGIIELDSNLISCYPSYPSQRLLESYVIGSSLRARKWIEMPSIDASNETYSFRIGSDGDRGVVVDDTLYWTPISQLRLREGEEAHIAGLNLVNGEMKNFPLMNLLLGYNEVVSVFRLNGCLSMCCYNSSRVTDVWMLKHQHDWKSWVKVSPFNLIENVELLWLFETGNCLVGEKRLKLLMLHDPSHVALDQEEESTGIRSIYAEKYIVEAWGYVESLISPFGTTLSDGNE